MNIIDKIARFLNNKAQLELDQIHIKLDGNGFSSIDDLLTEYNRQRCEYLELRKQVMWYIIDCERKTIKWKVLVRKLQLAMREEKARSTPMGQMQEMAKVIKRMII